MKAKAKSKIPKSVDAYLASLAEPARSTLNKIRTAILSVVPQETTEVISYQMPMYKYNGLLVGFAAFKEHCSLFGANGSMTEEFREDLREYSTSKGTIRFPLDKPLPAALVKKLVKARIAQNSEKAARKQAGKSQ